MRNIVPQHGSFEQSSCACLVCGSKQNVYLFPYGKGKKKHTKSICLPCDAIGKFCSLCSTFKLYGDFLKGGNHGRTGSWCKRCKSRNSHERYVRSEETKQERHRRNLKWQYGMTEDEYQSIYERQMGLCAICGKPETNPNKDGSIRHLAVDHCHASGVIRELLCHNCNQMLGFAQDNSETLKRAIKYLKKHAS